MIRHRLKFLFCFLIDAAPRIVFGNATPAEQVTIVHCYRQVVSGHVFFTCQAIGSAQDDKRTIFTDRAYSPNDVLVYESTTTANSFTINVLDSPESR